MTVLLDVRPGGRFAAWTRGFPLAIFQTSSGFQGAGVKRSAREADHSPSSSAEGKNEWRYTAAPSCCLFTNTDRVLQVLLLALCCRSVGRSVGPADRTVVFRTARRVTPTLLQACTGRRR